jgi:hypothetical protein
MIELSIIIINVKKSQNSGWQAHYILLPVPRGWVMGDQNAPALTLLLRNKINSNQIILAAGVMGLMRRSRRTLAGNHVAGAGEASRT